MQNSSGSKLSQSSDFSSLASYVIPTVSAEIDQILFDKSILTPYKLCLNFAKAQSNQSFHVWLYYLR